REKLRILRIRKNRDARINDLLAELVATALLGKGTAAFIGLARVEIKRHQLHEITNRLRLEYHSVTSRFARHRVARQARLLDRVGGEAGEIELLPVRVLAARPAGAGTVVGASRESIVGGRPSIVSEQ